MFQAHDIATFSQRGATGDTRLKVSQLSAQMGYPIVCVHVPKMDNDLPITDCSPGFALWRSTAPPAFAKGYDVASMARTSRVCSS